MTVALTAFRNILTPMIVGAGTITPKYVLGGVVTPINSNVSSISHPIIHSSSPVNSAEKFPGLQLSRSYFTNNKISRKQDETCKLIFYKAKNNHDFQEPFFTIKFPSNIKGLESIRAELCKCLEITPFAIKDLELIESALSENDFNTITFLKKNGDIFMVIREGDINDVFKKSWENPPTQTEIHNTSIEVAIEILTKGSFRNCPPATILSPKTVNATNHRVVKALQESKNFNRIVQASPALVIRSITKK